MPKKITSYDCPKWLKDKINAMTTDSDILAYRSTVKSPNQCSAGDPDLLIWNTCTAALSDKPNPTAFIPSDEQLKEIEWVNSDEYDEE